MMFPLAVDVHPTHLVLADGRVVRGATAARWLEAAPELAPEIAATLGEVAGRLATTDCGSAQHWRRDWDARFERWSADVRAHHLHLGEPLDRAVGPPGGPELDRLDRLALVHGDLGPEALWLDEALSPVTLLGLDAARPGDPLIDLACLLRLPDPDMRAIAVEAAGRTRMPESDLMRLQVYLRAGLLTDLLRAPDDLDARALYVEHIRARFEEVSDPARLLKGGPRRRTPDDPARAARRALEASPAIRSPSDQAAWLGALGAALLSASRRGDLAARLGLVARELAGRLPSTRSEPVIGSPSPGALDLGHRGVALLDDAVGAHVMASLSSAATAHPDLATVHAALARTFESGKRGSGDLPMALLHAVADDPLEGTRAALPAVAWAAAVAVQRGLDGAAILRGALAST